MALGALSGLTAAAAASPSGSKTEGWIKVPNATTLGKIGRDPDYPLNGTYRQTADIDGSQLNQSIGNKNDPFTGEYDGQCRTISNLSKCFVDTLKQGRIHHLHFTGANINSKEVAGLAACVVDVNGTVSDIWAENVHIFTLGKNADAGIGGAGFRNGCQHHGGEQHGRNLGLECRRRHRGGYRGGTVANTTAVNSRVNTTGDRADAGIGGGGSGTVANTTAVNSYVNGIKEGNSSISNDQLLCQKADLRVLTADCSLRTEFLDALDFSYDALDVSYSDACPVNAATATTAATVPTVATRRGAVVTNTTQVNSFARSSGYSSGVVREPLPATPAPTVADSTMNLTGLPGATMTLPTTAAPLAATLSTGVVVGIALGTAAFAVAGVELGRYIYRRYCRGSSAADDPQELVAINTVGQAYEEIETRNLRRIRTAVK